MDTSKATNLTMREYLAGQALTGVCYWYGTVGAQVPDYLKIADEAAILADVLIQRLNNGKL